MIILSGLIYHPVIADPYLEDDLGLWSPIYLEAPITERILGKFEVNSRIQENITHINQLIVRPSIGYKLNKNLSIWQGYGWNTFYIPRFLREQRLWNQILHEKEFSKLSLVNRFRFEERFIQDVEGVSLRARYLLRGLYPIGKTKRWGIALSDELFVNLNSHFNGPQAGIDQNRFFIGINRKLSNHADLEGGYQLQYINANRPKVDKLNHIILISLYIYLPQILK